ncbi:MAG: zf-HC2 domain-containing protein [Elusimicrobia bacterium]|nr:zf-HC2 domain-containing protein [Elusimicrobiota bacterium]
MTDHIHGLLSEYLDGELQPQKAKLVEEHLAACPECRRRLSDLSAVSKMLAGLPKHDLPAGFMARLKSRQARQRTASPRQDFFAWTLPVRAAALALSAFLVVFVAYEGLRERPLAGPPPAATADLDQEAKPASSAFDTAGKDAGMAAPAAPGPKAEVFRRKTAAFSQSGRALTAPRLAGGSALDEKAAPKKTYTNEELQRMIEEEKKRLGIKSIARRERTLPTDEDILGVRHPDREMIVGKPAPAALAGETPAMIAPTKLQTAAAPADIALGPAPQEAGMTFTAAAKGPSAPARQLAKADQDLDSDASGGGSAAPRIEVARSQDQLDSLWARRAIAYPKPAVDFQRQMLVMAPAAGQGEPPLDIVSVQETPDGILVLCRPRPSARAGEDSFRVVPIVKDLPVRLRVVR